MLLHVPQEFTESYLETDLLGFFNESVFFEKTLDQEVILDLSATKFIGPMAMLSLLTLGDFIKRELDYKWTLIPPSSGKTLSFLERRDFFPFAERCFIYRGYLNEASRQPRSIKRESTQFSSIYMIKDMYGLYSLLESIKIRCEKILIHNLDYNKDQIHQFVSVFTELCQNIPDHSESFGYTTIQALIYHYIPWVRICVSDIGIGIKQSVYKEHPRFEHKTELDALKYAISPGVTREHCELGLYAITCLVKEMGGMMHIRSGGSKISVLPSGRISQKTRLFWFPGVQVDVYFRQKSVER